MGPEDAIGLGAAPRRSCDEDSPRSVEAPLSALTQNLLGMLRMVGGEAPLPPPALQSLRDAPPPPALPSTRALACVAALPGDAKMAFLRLMARRLRVPWHVGHRDIGVTRRALLEDSMRAVLAVPGGAMRQTMRFAFRDDAVSALDAGGVAREWYTLCAQALFHGDTGVFRICDAREARYELCPKERWAGAGGITWQGAFRFAGRFIARSLLDGMVLPGSHLALPLLRHVLGLPLGLADLAALDPQLARHLLWMLDHDGADALSLTFSAPAPGGGARPLGGGYAADAPVDDANKADYVRLRFEQRALREAEGPLGAFLAGFYEVVPLAVVAPLDVLELDLAISGEDRIDVADWRAHTVYSGGARRDARAVKWFWQVVAELGEADKAKLLQYVTGALRVPVGGFRYLQGADGALRRFGIMGVSLDECAFLRAHTCFNRLDLPAFQARADVEAAVRAILSIDVSGFDAE